jgi:hypothetical protein
MVLLVSHQSRWLQQREERKQRDPKKKHILTDLEVKYDGTGSNPIQPLFSVVITNISTNIPANKIPT